MFESAVSQLLMLACLACLASIVAVALYRRERRRARVMQSHLQDKHREFAATHDREKKLQRSHQVLRALYDDLREREAHYHEIVESANDVIFTNDLRGRITSANAAAEQVLGYTREQLAGMNFSDFIAPEYIEQSRRLLADKITQAQSGEPGAPTFYETEVITKGGERVSLEVGTRLITRDATDAHIQGIARDITNRKRTERELKHQTALVELHQLIGAAANEAATIEIALQQCLKAICEFMHFPIGHCLLLASDGSDELVSARLWHLGERERFEKFKLASDEVRFKAGVGLPGKVLEAREALWFKDVVASLRPRGAHARNDNSTKNMTPRADTAEQLGIHTGFAFPLFIGAEVVGVLEFYAPEAIEPDAAMLGVLTHLGTQLGRALERERAERLLRESEERYALAAQGANDGLWDWDVTGNGIFFSARWKAMVGCEESEIGNNPQEWFSRVHLDDIDALRIKLTSHLDNHSAHFECEYRILHRQGGYRWMNARGVAVRDAMGTAIRLAGSQTDITERRQAEEQLLHDAFHDALTGLPNRGLFIDRLHLALERTKRDETYRFAVLYFDFDRFKNINDGLGHSVGDKMLTLVAARIKQVLRAGDTVARMNSDEFAILLDRVEDAHEPIRISERIEAALERPFMIGKHEVFTSISIGIALSSPAYTNVLDMLRDADSAMYRAKSGGRARHEVFDEAMHTRAVERLQLENDLRRAIERHELRVYYQPIVTLDTQALHGFEALVRWQHPKRGFLPPSEFITLAEESGLIMPVGIWVLREACRQMHEWHTRFPFEEPPTISVNLATKQLQHPEIVNQVAEVLAATGINARTVKLEITESGMMENTERVIQTLHQLKALGVNLSIDDFGTGYSCLSYLHRFPLNALKIDRSFVTDLRQGSENWQIVNTIIALARGLNMETVAEGVEHEAQVEHLKSLNCSYAQGYFFARPLSQEAATNYIRTHQPGVLTGELNAAEQGLDISGSLLTSVH